jgi:hypothetical protein
VGGTASAAPTGSKNAFSGKADCGTAGSYTFVVNNSNGKGKGAQNNGQNQAEWAPAHLSNGHIFHPTKFDVTFTFTPTGGQSQSFTNTDSRKNQVGNVTCQISGSQSSSQGTFALSGSVTGTITPH